MQKRMLFPAAIVLSVIGTGIVSGSNMHWALWLPAFAFSAVEEGMATRRTQATVAKNAVRSANWSAAFDLILFVDIMLLVVGGWWMILPVCSGSWVGSYYSVRSQNKSQKEE